MKLDYHEKTKKFTLRMPRNHAKVSELMTKHGLDFSKKRSTLEEACLYTDNDYAAMTFSDYATQRARTQFKDYLPELEASRLLGMDRKVKVPSGLDLYPFQKAGVDYVLRRPNALIGDSPGLGKTPMAIVTANEMDAQSILVICPANIRLQWQKKIHEWSNKWGVNGANHS